MSTQVDTIGCDECNERGLTMVDGELVDCPFCGGSRLIPVERLPLLSGDKKLDPATDQYWVVEEFGQWCVRRREPLATHGWETVKKFRSQDHAVAWAADRNARAMGLAAPTRRTPTAAEMKALFDGLGAQPIVDRSGRRYAVHHRNQHTD